MCILKDGGEEGNAESTCNFRLRGRKSEERNVRAGGASLMQRP